MRRYKYKQIYEWSHNLAYIAGLIASDGCLYGNGRHINLTSKDIDQLETVRQILRLKGEVKTKPNGFGGIGHYIQFSNVALYDFLYNAGIQPAKSKSITKINIPDEFYADFLRGYFDGDGSVYGFWDKRWRSSLMYYTDYASASPKFLDWLRKENSRLAGVSIGRIKSMPGVSSLNYAKQDSRLLFEFMYYAPDLPALRRKRIKFIDFLRTDPYASRTFLERIECVSANYAAVTESVDVLV